jgi:hypothetical protein
MEPTPVVVSGNPEQFERLFEAARKADVDESSKAFERAFEKIILPKRRK